jgi:hypothetical protein
MSQDAPEPSGNSSSQIQLLILRLVPGEDKCCVKVGGTAARLAGLAANLADTQADCSAKTTSIDPE